jgi:hypothetical protein
MSSKITLKIFFQGSKVSGIKLVKAFYNFLNLHQWKRWKSFRRPIYNP